MNLGGRIKLCLDAKCWTQADLVKSVDGLDRANLSALIRRDAKRSAFAFQIATVLGCRLEWLLSGAGAQWVSESANYQLNQSVSDGMGEPKIDSHAKLLALFNELPYGEQQNVLSYVEVRKQACDQLFQDILKLRGVDIVPMRRAKS
jgi:hypothetical protein